jgi:hypothetical protein
MDSGATIAVMQTAARALRSGSDREAVRAIQAAQDALDAAKAERLASLAETCAYELDGASSLNAWLRNELRLGANQAANLVRASSTLAQLPAVAKAAEAGLIRAEHVAAFTYGIKHIGFDTIRDAESWLLDVARTCEPLELVKVVRALREAIFPDELDKAWAEGMDKQDVQVVAVPGGWHVTGFLSAAVGAKFKAVLDAVAKPTDKDDRRSGSERRVDGLDQLLTKVLEGGLPSDKGIRPHMSVIVDAETLQAAVEPGSSEAPAPAQLAGYGSVGPKLLTYLACVSDFTPILTQVGFPKETSPVLNVGRSHRLATLKQRRGVIARQGGICAAPGCHNTHLEIHHIIWWSHGGKTDIDVLIGLCSRCHHLVHRKLLIISGNATDGFQFANQDNRAIRAEFKARVRRRRHEREMRRTNVLTARHQWP